MASSGSANLSPTPASPHTVSLLNSRNTQIDVSQKDISQVASSAIKEKEAIDNKEKNGPIHGKPAQKDEKVDIQFTCVIRQKKPLTKEEKRAQRYVNEKWFTDLEATWQKMKDPNNTTASFPVLTPVEARTHFRKLITIYNNTQDPGQKLVCFLFIQTTIRAFGIPNIPKMFFGQLENLKKFCDDVSNSKAISDIYSVTTIQNTSKAISNELINIEKKFAPLLDKFQFESTKDFDTLLKDFIQQLPKDKFAATFEELISLFQDHRDGNNPKVTEFCFRVIQMMVITIPKGDRFTAASPLFGQFETLQKFCELANKTSDLQNQYPHRLERFSKMVEKGISKRLLSFELFYLPAIKARFDKLQAGLVAATKKFSFLPQLNTGKFLYKSSFGKPKEVHPATMSEGQLNKLIADLKAKNEILPAAHALLLASEGSLKDSKALSSKALELANLLLEKSQDLSDQNNQKESLGYFEMARKLFIAFDLDLTADTPSLSSKDSWQETTQQEKLQTTNPIFQMARKLFSAYNLELTVDTEPHSAKDSQQTTTPQEKLQTTNPTFENKTVGDSSGTEKNLSKQVRQLIKDKNFYQAAIALMSAPSNFSADSTLRAQAEKVANELVDRSGASFAEGKLHEASLYLAEAKKIENRFQIRQDKKFTIHAPDRDIKQTFAEKTQAMDAGFEEWLDKIITDHHNHIQTDATNGAIVIGQIIDVRENIAPLKENGSFDAKIDTLIDDYLTQDKNLDLLEAWVTGQDWSKSPDQAQNNHFCLLYFANALGKKQPKLLERLKEIVDKTGITPQKILVADLAFGWRAQQIEAMASLYESWETVSKTSISQKSQNAHGKLKKARVKADSPSLTQKTHGTQTQAPATLATTTSSFEQGVLNGVKLVKDMSLVDSPNTYAKAIYGKDLDQLSPAEKFTLIEIMRTKISTKAFLKNDLDGTQEDEKDLSDPWRTLLTEQKKEMDKFYEEFTEEIRWDINLLESTTSFSWSAEVKNDPEKAKLMAIKLELAKKRFEEEPEFMDMAKEMTTTMTTTITTDLNDEPEFISFPEPEATTIVIEENFTQKERSLVQELLTRFVDTMLKQSKEPNYEAVKKVLQNKFSDQVINSAIELAKEYWKERTEFYNRTLEELKKDHQTFTKDPLFISYLYKRIHTSKSVDDLPSEPKEFVAEYELFLALNERINIRQIDVSSIKKRFINLAKKKEGEISKYEGRFNEAFTRSEEFRKSRMPHLDKYLSELQDASLLKDNEFLEFLRRKVFDMNQDPLKFAPVKEIEEEFKKSKANKGQV